MSTIKQKLIKAVDIIISQNSMLSAVFIFFLGIYQRDMGYIKYGLLRRKHNKAVMPLMDINVLNKYIKHIKDMAQSSSAKKKFYVISRGMNDNQGLFAFVTLFFIRIFYAVAKGMIPVIDMQTYPNSYLEENETGLVNAWEKFFKQPCGYSLGDIANQKSYTNNGRQELLPNFIFSEQETFDIYLKLWAALYKNFFEINDNVKQHVDKEYIKLFKPDMRVIGVHFRGTDYTSSRPSGLPVQPSAEDVINKVSSLLHEWKCDYVYIATEEHKTLSMFENAFPGKVLSADCQYYDNSGVDYSRDFIATVRFDRENDTYLRGLEYLTSIMLLSRCSSAVISACSGSMAALYINGGKYENTYIFNLGVY